VLLTPLAARAQAPAQRGRLIVTVADPSGAIVQDANVTVVGLDTATKAVTLPPVKTTDKGTAIFEGLVLGRYSIRAEFPGFEMGLLRDIKVNRGDNKHIVVLPLRGLSDSVTVGPDRQQTAADRASTFGTALTREQVDALSDDPNEMQQQLQEMAGGGATIRVDSFEGQQLPPKAQIKAIHITRDQFAAENHRFEGLFIDIITQPGIGALHGNLFTNFYDSALDGTNPLIGKKGAAQNRNFGFSISRALLKNKADFNVFINGFDNYQTAQILAFTPHGTIADNANVRTPSSNIGVGATFNYAVTKDQTIRVGFNSNRGEQDNLGIGGFNLLDRAYSSTSRNTTVRFQEAGPIGRRFFINTRIFGQFSNSDAHSLVEAPTIVVVDAFTSGGAQVAGGRKSRGFSALSDLDYVRGINSWRMGVSIEGGYYQTDDATNYLGTYTFGNSDAFLANAPRSYTKRIGDPLIKYWNVQMGAYVQDDVRISKSLTLTPGVRYEAQTHVSGRANVAPRFGVTWAPFKNGKTTLRGSWGIFYDWLGTGTYEQVLRVDGVRQQQINILNPAYPNPGDVGAASPTDKYLLTADLPMTRNERTSAGVQQAVTKFFNVGGTFTYGRGLDLLIGENLNAPVNGLRPNPLFANLVESVPDGRSRVQQLSLNFNLYVPPAPGGPAAAANAPRFVWKRGLSVFGNVFLAKNENNTNGPFSLPFDPTLRDEWGPAQFDIRRRTGIYIGSGALKSFNGQIGFTQSTGVPINVTTGFDGNGDSVFNDRPAGYARNSARGGGQWNMNGYFSYSFGFGKQSTPTQPGIMIMNGAGGLNVTTMNPTAAPRYRINLSVNLQNLTNHANYSGYVGTISSTHFLQPITITGVRRITFSIGVGF
jgi:hypothetical protein